MIDLQPKQSLGQNFLMDENITRKMIRGLNLKSTETIIEVGCGKGMLTKYLLKGANDVIGIEIDRRLIALLRTQFSNISNFHLVQADILEYDWHLLPSHSRLVGNLPFHITSPFLFKFFEFHRHFEDATIMVQKEVADRITADSGTKEYGILSVFSQFFCDVKKCFPVSRNCFYPKPKVDSTVIRLTVKPNLPKVDLKTFTELVKRTFNQRRKMLRVTLKDMIENKPGPLEIHNNLFHRNPSIVTNKLTWSRFSNVAFDFEQRPEQLSVNDFVHLASLFSQSNHFPV